MNEPQQPAQPMQAHSPVEENLNAKELRYQQLASLTTEGVMVHQNGIILDANQAFAKLVGFANPDELIGKNALEIIPLTPSGRQCMLDHINSSTLESHEVELKNADGTLVPTEVSCRDIEYLGRPCRLVSMQDITLRKQAEARLTRQLERLNVLHTLDQAVAGVMDLDAILKLFVQQIVEQIKIDACAILLHNPETQTLNFAAKQGFLTHALEFTHLRVGTGLAGRAAKDQHVVFIPDLTEIKNNPALTLAIANENFIMYAGIPLVVKGNLVGVLEIFHRSKMTPEPGWVKFLEILANEAALAIDNARLLGMTQQSYKETNALYQINKKLIATVDPQELMDDVVSLLQHNFGYHYVQIFVTDKKTGHIVMRAGSGELGARLKSEGYHLLAGDGIVGVTAETGKPFFTNEVEAVFTFIRPPYLTGTNSELAVPIRTETQFLGLLDIHQKAPFSLTERDVQLVTAVADQLAVALQKSMLHTDLQEALRQEQATRTQLIHQEKLTVAGRLLASVSHELNNPIQAIQNALFLLKEEQELSPQGKQDLETVLSETERMAAMLARLRSTYQPVSLSEFKPVNINELVQDVSALVATHLRHNQISLELQLEPTLPRVSGLKDQIKQVVINLVMNSVEAMTKGGQLTISTKYMLDSQQALITVSDTGPGIEPDILPNIFDAFITTKEHGTGLGLTISNEIILRHGGQ